MYEKENRKFIHADAADSCDPGQARSFAEEYTSSTQTILEMDVANLDQYIQGLRIFCVQPCLNVSVYNSLLKRKPLSSSEISDIKQEIQSSYHSRTDIRSYSITAMNQDLCFERNAGTAYFIDPCKRY